VASRSDLEIEKDLDLKITLSWDTNFTDLDLHVKEPSGEEVSYEHNFSKAGATLTQDNTSGFGPEIYRLRSAAQGEYLISLSYYSKDSTSANADSTAWVVVQRRNSKGVMERTAYPVLLQTSGERIEVARIRM
jgi:uncharacterized protein YfaP (DUF2135 family)